MISLLGTSILVDGRDLLKDNGKHSHKGKGKGGKKLGSVESNLKQQEACPTGIYMCTSSMGYFLSISECHEADCDATCECSSGQTADHKL